MTTKETIKHWAKDIIPAVFLGETNLLKKHPEWKKRLKSVTDENRNVVAEAYCRAIAEEIVLNSKEE